MSISESFCPTVFNTSEQANQSLRITKVASENCCLQRMHSKEGIKAHPNPKLASLPDS